LTRQCRETIVAGFEAKIKVEIIESLMIFNDKIIPTGYLPDTVAMKKTEHISAGQFKAGKNQRLIYQAYLGTCLGVALYDFQADVGGMIHILLPEPPGPASALDHPEKYAATGLPMLIEKMVDLGARRDNIQATIAGGALVGPITRQDMNLDIGGRSADIASTVLKAEGIHVVNSETGGFFTCTLELDMETGKTRIQAAWEDIQKSGDAFKAPSMDEISATIDQLKPIPQAALKILRIFQSPYHHITDITDELIKDQVLAAQTLKLCNSALYSGTIQVDTLKDAVLLMGEEMLVKTIVCAAVDTYYKQSSASGYSLCRGGIFYHSVGVAELAEKIAVKSRSPYLKTAYTAGLLHDIGKVILDQFVADRSPLFFRKLSQSKTDFLASEKKLLGITHSEAGAILAKRWLFSGALHQVIQYHHTPEKAQSDKALIYIVNLADYLMEKFSTGFELEKMDPDGFEIALDHCGLTVADIPELVDTIPLKIFKNEDF